MKVIHITVDIKIPRTPNFFLDSSGQTFPIAGVTDAGIRQIGKEWTEELVKKAQKRRKEKSR